MAAIEAINGRKAYRIFEGTSKQADSYADKLRRTDKKLRNMGGIGNYDHVEVSSTFALESGLGRTRREAAYKAELIRQKELSA